MRLYLVRHGESEGNVDKSVYKTVADHAVELTGKGREQARAAGDWFASQHDEKDVTKYRFWVSPYTRARQTSDEFISRLDPKNVLDRREMLMFAEQQFGALNDGHGDHVERIKEAYRRDKSHGGRLFSRPWGGESRFDVCVRVHQAFGTLHRDAERHAIRNLVIVAHGTTIRSIVMMWMHYNYEWFDTAPNPPNGSIQCLSYGKNQGYVFNGPKS
jgi:2,3-bisphosphoglycerate-dependent phosphoglycerate mutase